MQYGARQLGCTKVQVHSYPDEPSHGARCSSAPVVTRINTVRLKADWSNADVFQKLVLFHSCAVLATGVTLLESC